MTISQITTRQPESPRPSEGPLGFSSLSTSADRRSQWRGTRIAGIVVAVMVMLFLQHEVAYADGGFHSQLQLEIASEGSSQYQLPPKILVLRGVFEVFSLGMNDLARKLRCQGYDAKVTSWSLALLHAKCSDQQPIVLIGHSLGGRMCGWVPRKLRKCGKRVPLVIIVDANLNQCIPDNVDKCLNLYVTNSIGIFHGSPVRGESAGTKVINWNVSRGQPSFWEGGVNHFNIDATAWVHQIVIDEITATFPIPENFVANPLVARKQPVIGSRLPPGSSPLKLPASAAALPRPRRSTSDSPAARPIETAARFVKQEATTATSEPVVWRPTRPEVKRWTAPEGGESPQVQKKVEELRIEPTPTLVVWLPTRPEVSRWTTPETGESLAAERKAAQPKSRVGTRPLLWRSPHLEAARQPAAETSELSSEEPKAGARTIKIPRIRFPQGSPNS